MAGGDQENPQGSASTEKERGSGQQGRALGAAVPRSPQLYEAWNDIPAAHPSPPRPSEHPWVLAQHPNHRTRVRI